MRLLRWEGFVTIVGIGKGNEGPLNGLKAKLMLPEGEVKQELDGRVGELENSEIDRFLFMVIVAVIWMDVARNSSSNQGRNS